MSENEPGENELGDSDDTAPEQTAAVATAPAFKKPRRETFRYSRMMMFLLRFGAGVSFFFGTRLLDERAQTRLEPRGLVPVNKFLGGGLIELLGGGLERRFGGPGVAAGSGFMDIANHGSQRRPGGPVSQPVFLGLSIRLGGISVIGHGLNAKRCLGT